MNDWQNRRISDSLLPLGSKSEPPLAPPMGRVVSEFLNVCSKARNLSTPGLTVGWKRKPALVGSDRTAHLDPVAPVDVDLAVVVHPVDAEADDPIGLDQALEDLVLDVSWMAHEDWLERGEPPHGRPDGSRAHQGFSP